MTNKYKGFTIVELVIVIAVVAILATVLIPIFSAIVKRANISADTQAVRNMNVILASESAESSAPGGIEAVVSLLRANGITDLTPQTRFYKFFWLEGDNVIILTDEGDRPVYPEEYVGEGLAPSWHALDGDEAVTFPAATRNPNEDAQSFTVTVTQSGFASVDIPFEIPRVAKEGDEFRVEIGLPEEYQKGVPISRYYIKTITVIMKDGESERQVVLRSKKAQESGREALFEVDESALLYISCVTGNIEINIDVVEYALVTLEGDNMSGFMLLVYRNDEGFTINCDKINMKEGYMVTSAIGTQNGNDLGELYVKENQCIRSDTVSFMNGDLDIKVETKPKNYNVDLVLNKPGEGTIHTQTINVKYSIMNPDLSFTVDLNELGLNITEVLGYGYDPEKVNLLDRLRPNVDYNKDNNTLTVSDVKCDFKLICTVKTEP